MDLNQRSVEELERQIERQKAELDKRLEAVRLVREMLAEGSAEQAPAAVEAEADTPSEAQGPPYSEELLEDGPSLIESIEDLLKRENRAWNVPQVYNALQAKSFPFGSKTPKGSIGTALTRLADRGHAVLVKKGSGRRPHQYKAKRWVPDVNTAISAFAAGDIKAGDITVDDIAGSPSLYGKDVIKM